MCSRLRRPLFDVVRMAWAGPAHRTWHGLYCYDVPLAPVVLLEPSRPACSVDLIDTGAAHKVDYLWL